MYSNGKHIDSTLCWHYLWLGILQRPVEAVVLQEAWGKLRVAKDGAGNVAARAVAVVARCARGGVGGGGVVRLAQGKQARVLRVEARVAGPGRLEGLLGRWLLGYHQNNEIHEIPDS